MFQGIKRLFLFLLLAIVFFPSKAQKYTGNSPYSEFGLGDIQPVGTVRNMGMADVGVSMSTYEYINNMNPALLPANKYMNFDSAANNYTTLDAAGVYTLRKISNGQNIGVDASVYEAYLNLALPVSSKWVANIGLQPYSLIAYRSSKITGVSNAPDTTVTYGYNGSGGVYKVYVGNGIDLTKNLSAGLEVGYLFGDGTHNSSSQVALYYKYNETLDISSQYNGMSLKPGLAYRCKIAKREFQDSAVYFNLGAVAEIIPVLRSLNNTNFQRYDSINNLLESFQVNRQIPYLRVPTTYRAGLSVDKPGRWNVGLDVNYSNWGNYRGIDAMKLFPSYGIALGGEYHTQWQDEMRRMVFRSGFSYTKTPIIIDNITINDYSFTLGGSFPLGRQDAADRRKPLSKANIALIFGDRGTTQMNLVKDLYFKVFVGFIINDRWFGKSKVE